MVGVFRAQGQVQEIGISYSNYLHHIKVDSLNVPKLQKDSPTV